MQAKYANTCRACGVRYGVGEEIGKGPQGWVHAGCLPPSPPLREVKRAETTFRCDWKRCKHANGLVVPGDAVETLSRFGTWPRVYHADCFAARERAVKYAQACEHARAIGFDTPEAYARFRSEQAEKERQDAGELRERLYWERVDNYRELGYDPNQGE